MGWPFGVRFKVTGKQCILSPIRSDAFRGLGLLPIHCSFRKASLSFNLIKDFRKPYLQRWCSISTMQTNSRLYASYIQFLLDPPFPLVVQALGLLQRASICASITGLPAFSTPAPLPTVFGVVRRRLDKVTRQKKISNTLLYPVLVPTIAAHHPTLANFGLEKEDVQVPQYFFTGDIFLVGCFYDVRYQRDRLGSRDCWLLVGNGIEAELIGSNLERFPINSGKNIT